MSPPRGIGDQGNRAFISWEQRKNAKGTLTWYGKITWESAHAWNLNILCLLIVWGMTFIFMVHLSFLCNSIANL